MDNEIGYISLATVLFPFLSTLKFIDRLIDLLSIPEDQKPKTKFK